jgi:UDP-N-acetylmuramate--alanine ligase
VSASARERELPWRGRRLHLVGVGGAGMSAYARAARELGAQVTGSDAADSPYLESLVSDGVLQASVGHRVENLPAGERVEVVYSSAVPDDNVELAEARRRGLALHPRAWLLAELTGMRRTIAVAGTHGKTTTAAMIVHALRAAGLDPGWLVGGLPGDELANAHWGAGEWLVVEADESDRSMLSVQLCIAVLTNVELDHHATFSSLAELHAAFASFLALARAAIVVYDRPELLALAPGAGAAELIPYASDDYELTRGGARFAWRGETVSLAVPGAHNVANALAALEAARLTGATPRLLADSLASFTGAGRRFQLLGKTPAGAVVYDDYAHHPTEIQATLAAARTLAPERLIAVFQPHLYSRTKLLAREFGSALAAADVAVLLDVYPARERASDYPGVSGLMLAETTADASAGKPVYWLPQFADAEPVLRDMLTAGDVCLIMGAGDIDSLARRLVAA